MSDDSYAKGILERARARQQLIEVMVSEDVDESSDGHVDEESSENNENDEVLEETSGNDDVEDNDIQEQEAGGDQGIPKLSRKSSPMFRRGRLANLAQTINNWEDDPKHQCSPSSRYNYEVPKDRGLGARQMSPKKSTVSLHEVDGKSEMSPRNSPVKQFGGSPLKLPTTPVKQGSPSKVTFQVKSSSPSKTLFNSPTTSTHFPSSPPKYRDSSPVRNAQKREDVGSPTMSPTKPADADGSFKTSPTKKPFKLHPLPKFPSPNKSPVKPAEHTMPTSNVVDSMRKQFESNIKRSPDGKPIGISSKCSVAEKKYYFDNMSCAGSAGASFEEKDPSELSVAERAKMFEKVFFQLQNEDISAIETFQKSTRAGARKNMLAQLNADTAKTAAPSLIRKPIMEFTATSPQKWSTSDSSDDLDSDIQEVGAVTYSTGVTHPSLPAKECQGVPPVVNKSPPPPPPFPLFSAKGKTASSPSSPSRPINISDQEVEAPRCALQSILFGSPILCKKRSVSPKAQYPGARDVKRIKVNDPKPGSLYPSLTDIETGTETEGEVEDISGATEYEYEDEDMDSETSHVSGSSLGTHIELVAKSNSPIRQHLRYRPSEDNFNASLACRQVDALMNEALEGEDFTMDTLMEEPTPLSTSSPQKKDLSPVPLNNVPLLHTISFYRKQQAMNTPSSSKAIKLVATLEENVPKSPERLKVKETISNKIKLMEDEIIAQERSIAQVCKALNLCKSTVEFSESTENIECERVLLIATHKRLALMNEIHRLKTEGVLTKKSCISPSKYELGPNSRGSITINDLSIQLKRDFISKVLKAENVYHFIVMVSYRQHIEATNIASVGNHPHSQIPNGLIHFPTAVTIDNLEPDFTLKLDVYMLHTRKEFLPHDAKYHIKKALPLALKNITKRFVAYAYATLPKIKKVDTSTMTMFLNVHEQESKGKGGLLTPKKQTPKLLQRPFHQSPAGPDAVRSPNFTLAGTLSIDITTLQRTHWNLERSMSSPLEGSIAMNIQCSADGDAEHRGFLTMFDDLNGLGSWNRRWCKLTPHFLMYWKYPEDENKMECSGKISLRYCVTTRVGPISRDLCARQFTFLLVTTRKPQAGDSNSLVMSCHKEYTAIRHLLSADCKEDRDTWCRHFNRTLANLRAWDPKARSPDDSIFQV